MKMEEVDDGRKLEITTVGQKEELERFVQVSPSLRLCASAPLRLRPQPNP